MPFEKGNKFGKGQGRPKLTADEKKISLMTKTAFRRIVDKFFHMKADEFQAYMAMPERTVLEAMVGRVFKSAIVDGNLYATQLILDRTIGKVKEDQEAPQIRPTKIITSMGVIELGAAPVIEGEVSTSEGESDG